MDWLILWFWFGIILIVAALIPNEEYNWMSLLYSFIDNFLAKREAKKYPDFATRWREYLVKDKELKKFYDEKIFATKRNIEKCSEVLCLFERDDISRKEIENALKKYKDELLEYETMFEKHSIKLSKEFKELWKERKKLGIKHL